MKTSGDSQARQTSRGGRECGRSWAVPKATDFQGLEGSLEIHSQFCEGSRASSSYQHLACAIRKLSLGEVSEIMGISVLSRAA